MSAAVAARTTKPALMNVKAVAQDDSLTLAAYDTEVGIRYALPGVTVPVSGSCILPLVELVKILRESDGPDVTLSADGDAIVARTGGDRYEMPSLDVNEFPDVPSFDDAAPYHEVAAGALRVLIGRTLFAADKKDTTAKFALRAVLWEADADGVRLVATDTKRLAVSNAPATLSGDPDDKPHLVPLKAVALLEKNLPDDDAAPVRVVLRTNDAMFRTDRAEIYTSLVQGKFPPYATILKVAHKGKEPHCISLPAAAFASCVRRAAIMTDAESQRIDMTFAPGSVKLAARGANTGASDVTMLLPEYTGPRLEVAFDPVYVGDFLRALDDGAVALLEIADGTLPAVFTCGDDYRYLVMPLTG